MSSPILIRPRWAINNQFTLPLITQGTGKLSVRGLFQVFLPVTLFLDSLFDESEGLLKKRSVAETDQLQIFRSIESILSTMGVDGRACLLRTICELQSYPIMNNGLMGEILILVLTPKRGENDFLRDYQEAEKVGRTRNATAKGCGRQFPNCPFSVFDVIKKWSKAPQTVQTVYFDDYNDNKDSSIQEISSAKNSDNELATDEGASTNLVAEKKAFKPAFRKQW
ncbi:uncharacterized protein LOC136028424 [Artemia franciscana]|uniref:uncharacterized protein LOC136028424 n=1 Tax=Artemia franciscana TaxID=6661 RepID=UPI0032DA0AA4